MSATLSLQQRWGQKVGRKRGEDFNKKKTVNSIVIKPGPARRVDPGPGGWTGPGLTKDRLW
jgi:hypothetical protein